MKKNLIKKINDRKARIAVIGMGYVGLPLAVEFGRTGFKVTGIDLDSRKVKSLNKGRSYISDVPSGEVKDLIKKNKFKATDKYSCLSAQDVIIICVPTPLRKTKEPDMSYIVHAAEKIAAYMGPDKSNKLVVLESTTYPGTTREVILPLLQSKGVKAGRDFCLAFSPERVDPGNKEYKTKDIPKVVGGITKNCAKTAQLLYASIINKVVMVSSAEAAEMAKLLENTFRSVNIGLVNELALMCHQLGIDTWEVIRAAGTKPFGFMPFYPGPGLGGHCIPIDPIYLSWKARLHGFEARFIDLASQVNAYMPHYVIDRISEALNERKKSIKGSSILILGVAYKKDVSDTRESPAFEIITGLEKKGARVSYHDPYVPEFKLNSRCLRSVKLTQANLKNKDCVVIITDHSCFDYQSITRSAKLVVDTRNATAKSGRNLKKIVKL